MLAEDLRIAVVVGHSEGSRSEAHAVDGIGEWEFQSKVADDAVRYLKARRAQVQLWSRKKGQSLQKVIREVNKFKAHFAVELHFNSITPPAAGTEGLFWPTSAAGAALAWQLAQDVNRVVAVQGARLPRAVGQVRSWNAEKGTPPIFDARGIQQPNGPWLEFLRDTTMPAVLLETHFGNHRLQHALAMLRRDDGTLGRAVALSLLAYGQKL